MCSMGLYSGEYDGRKINLCNYFPAKFCKTFFLRNVALPMMRTYSFSNSSSNQFFEHRSPHHSVAYVRRHELAFTVCCDKPNLTIPLAADTNVNPFSRLLCAYWRYICVLIPILLIYADFFFRISLIFFKYASTYLGACSLQNVLFFCVIPSFLSRLKTEDE